MVMPLGAIKLTCKKCGWSVFSYEKSDCLIMRKCKKCGFHDMRMEKTPLSIFIGKIIKFFP